MADIGTVVVQDAFAFIRDVPDYNQSFLFIIVDDLQQASQGKSRHTTSSADALTITLTEKTAKFELYDQRSADLGKIVATFEIDMDKDLDQGLLRQYERAIRDYDKERALWSSCHGDGRGYLKDSQAMRVVDRSRQLTHNMVAEAFIDRLEKQHGFMFFHTDDAKDFSKRLIAFWVEIKMQVPSQLRKPAPVAGRPPPPKVGGGTLGGLAED